MKVYVLQPSYPKSGDEKKNTVGFILQSLDSVRTDADLILLPEFANIPGASQYDEMIADYNGIPIF